MKISQRKLKTLIREAVVQHLTAKLHEADIADQDKAQQGYAQQSMQQGLGQGPGQVDVFRRKHGLSIDANGNLKISGTAAVLQKIIAAIPQQNSGNIWHNFLDLAKNGSEASIAQAVMSVTANVQGDNGKQALIFTLSALQSGQGNMNYQSALVTLGINFQAGSDDKIIAAAGGEQSAYSITSNIQYLAQNDINSYVRGMQNATEQPAAETNVAAKPAATQPAQTKQAKSWEEYAAKGPKFQRIQQLWTANTLVHPAGTAEFNEYVTWWKHMKTQGNWKQGGTPDEVIQYLQSIVTPDGKIAAAAAANDNTPAV